MKSLIHDIYDKAHKLQAPMFNVAVYVVVTRYLISQEYSLIDAPTLIILFFSLLVVLGISLRLK